MLLIRSPVRKSNTSTVFCSSEARNKRLPFRSSPKWSKSPVKPGMGVVAINFSGSFSCAFTVGAHKTNAITQIFNDCRNLSLLGSAACRADKENSIGGALFLPLRHLLENRTTRLNVTIKFQLTKFCRTGQTRRLVV